LNIPHGWRPCIEDFIQGFLSELNATVCCQNGPIKTWVVTTRTTRNGLSSGFRVRVMFRVMQDDIRRQAGREVGNHPAHWLYSSVSQVCNLAFQLRKPYCPVIGPKISIALSANSTKCPLSLLIS